MVSEVRTLAAGSWWRVDGSMVLLLIAAASALVLSPTIGWIVDIASRSGQSGIPAVFWWELAGLGVAALVGGAVEFSVLEGVSLHIGGAATAHGYSPASSSKSSQRFSASASSTPASINC